MIWFNYDNFDYIKWKTYNAKLDNKGIIGLLEDLLDDLDVQKGFAIVDSFMYNETIGVYFRTLNKLSNYILYNTYLNKLIKLDEDNREIERIREEHRISKHNNDIKRQKPVRKKKKGRTVISHSTDIFDGSDVYIVDNTDNGTIKVLHDIPEELKETNKKEKKKKIPKEYKDFNGIVFNFRRKDL